MKNNKITQHAVKSVRVLRVLKLNTLQKKIVWSPCRRSVDYENNKIT